MMKEEISMIFDIQKGEDYLAKSRVEERLSLRMDYEGGQSKKIMIVGNWRWPHLEIALARGLIEAGHEVRKFSVSPFLDGVLGKYRHALPFPGPALLQLNRQLLHSVRADTPEILLAWRCTHLLPSTISRITGLGVITASYNNDDPFGPRFHGQVPWHHHVLWYWYLKSLKHYSCNFFYRKTNVDEALLCGASHADVLLPYFMPWRDRPIELTNDELKRFDCDVVFVGHYEPDGREHFLRRLVEAEFSVNLFGGGYWTKTILGDLYEYFTPIERVSGDEYVKALCGAKVCLAFLSKLNRDTYTRRCFEIPACGCVMLAERTDDLLKMFKEDEEACFFTSCDELIAKVKWLVANPDIRTRIAQAGFERVWNDGHDVNSRADTFVRMLTEA